MQNHLNSAIIKQNLYIYFSFMDIRKISMFLAWKLPPYYGSSNLYAFTKALRNFAKEEFTNDEMTFIQTQAKWVDEEVYFMVLDDLWKNTQEEQVEWKKSKKDIVELLKTLWVNDEVLGIEKKEEVKIKSKTIWFITPFDDTWIIRKDILNEISSKFWYWVQEVKMGKDSSWNFLWDSIVWFLNKYSLYIVDIRGQNLNVAIELGYILAKEKEVIVITDKDLPSDIRGFKYIKPEKIEYTAWNWWLDNEEINQIEINLKSNLWKAIKAKVEYLESKN